MLPFTVIDCALLVGEWASGRCAACFRTQDTGHDAGCFHDQALAERGFPTQESRDRARARLEGAQRPTEAPPAPPSTVPPEGAPPE